MAQAIRPMPEEMPPELWRGFKPKSATWQGSVAAIFITPQSACEMVSVPEIRAFADRGLEGDRFFRESWNAVNRPDKAVSLIEDEVLQLAAKELSMDSIGVLTRRNIVTRGVPLIELLGQGIHRRRSPDARHPFVRTLRPPGKGHPAASHLQSPRTSQRPKSGDLERRSDTGRQSDRAPARCANVSCAP